jgi:tagatose 6-phosphate kinase
VITVVCLNPALDVTHHVRAVDWAGVNRPETVHARPGGKGLNVARTLAALGADVLVLALAGGPTGAAVAEALDVPAAFTPIAADTRRTFTVVDPTTGRTAGFYEPGPTVTQAEFTAFQARYRRVLSQSQAVVLSGSLPPGLPGTTYAALIHLATAANVPTLLDTHGPPLRQAAAAQPTLVKPNLPELQALTGHPLSIPAQAAPAEAVPPEARPDLAAVAAAAAELCKAGAQSVVVTLGPDGLLAVTADGRWHARSGAPVPGNTTGAGDAVAAALAHGLVLNRPWPERLRHAAALGAAAAAASVAGEFDPAAYRAALASVTVEQIPPPREAATAVIADPAITTSPAAAAGEAGTSERRAS